MRPEIAARPGRASEASIFDLVNAVNEILKRVSKREDLREIFEDKWSVSEKIESLLKLIGGKVVAQVLRIVQRATSRTEVVCTFLALLELIRLKQLLCVQPGGFWDN